MRMNHAKVNGLARMRKERKRVKENSMLRIKRSDATPKQLKLLKDLGVDTDNLVLNKHIASQMISKLLKR